MLLVHIQSLVSFIYSLAHNLSHDRWVAPINLSVCLSVGFSICISVCHNFLALPCTYLSNCSNINLSVCLSVGLSICLSVCHNFLTLPCTYLSNCSNTVYAWNISLGQKFYFYPPGGVVDFIILITIKISKGLNRLNFQ